MLRLINHHDNKIIELKLKSCILYGSKAKAVMTRMLITEMDGETGDRRQEGVKAHLCFIPPVATVVLVAATAALPSGLTAVCS